MSEIAKLARPEHGRDTTTTFSISALAEAMHRRIRELRAREMRVTITPAMSRILVHDKDYVPRRRPGQSRPAANPTIRTLVRIAHALGTTVGELLQERGVLVSESERQTLGKVGRFLVRRFDRPEGE